LGRAKLLELAQTLSQNLELKHPQAVKKGDMKPMHQLLFGSSLRTSSAGAKGTIRLTL